MSPPNPIYELFGHSPIRPLQEHMNKVTQCVKVLPTFITHVIQNDWKNAELAQHKIAHLEKEADNLKNGLRLQLPSGLFLPVPRTDLLQMLSLQDRIANMAKDIAGIILGRKMSIPEPVTPSYCELLTHCIETADQAHIAINKLDSLLETGFKGQEVTMVEELIHQLHLTEHRTDEIQVQVRQSVFAVEKNYPPIDMMFLYKVIESTGELADRAEKVGGQLLVLIAK